jgi:hypothetical protein
MTRYALYVRQPREVPWERRAIYDTQAEAEAQAAGLVQGASDLEWGDDPKRIDETIVVAAEGDGGAPDELPLDHVVPVIARFSRQGLAG